MSGINQVELEKKRHSLAHILAMAVKRLYPDIKIGIGPVTDTGFYYEFDSTHKFNHEDLEQIEAEMQKIIQENLAFINLIIPRDQAEQTLLQLGETYKSELLSKILDQEVSFYKTGDEFIDLCRGPHVKTTGDLANFKLTQISTGHWLNDPTRPLLQKIEGVAFESKVKLTEFLENSKKLQDINSLEIAQRLDLIELLPEQHAFAPVWKENGIILQQQFYTYLYQELIAVGSSISNSPIIRTKPSFLTEKFSQFLPKSISADSTYLAHENWSYLLELLTDKKNITFDFATINSYLDSNSSLLQSELTSLESFQLKTAASNLTLTTVPKLADQIEIKLKLIGKILKVLGFNQFKTILEVPDYQRLDLYLYEESKWDQAIEIFKKIITDFKFPSKIKEGDADFMGPKMSIIVKDKFFREWKLASLVIDFMLVQELDLPTEDSVLLHTNILESLDRVYDLLLEHGEGRLPLWLSPRQVQIISLASSFNHKAIKVERELRESNIRVSSDLTEAKPEAKIAKALSHGYPYIIIIGEKEANTDALSIKTSSGQDIGLMRITEFQEKLKSEIKAELSN